MRVHPCTQSSGQANGVDATINILNTPNKRIRELNKDLYNKVE